MSGHSTRTLLIGFAFVLMLAMPSLAMAMTFDVTNVRVGVQATDAVKARDLAILDAQRKALAVLVGRTPQEISAISDAEIARLVRGFSVKGEKLASRSYVANFTIRFNPNLTMNFIRANGYDLIEQARTQTGPIDANPNASAQTPLVAGAATDPMTGQEGAVSVDPTAVPAPATNTIVILPVLDIGSKTVLWGDPNPWREIWQQEDMSQKGLSVRVPLGDIEDYTDVPDATVLSGQGNIANVLSRYTATNAYIIVAKNQGSGGMLLSLYRHDGKKLNFIKKIIINPRPGYMFNDAVPAAMQMIVMAHNNAPADNDASRDTAALPNDPLDAADTTPVDPVAQAPIDRNTPITVTVPYQTLQQWVGIQARLRQTVNVQSIVPMRVSPSSAQVRLMTTASDMTMLRNALAAQNLDLQLLPTGEMMLIER